MVWLVLLACVVTLLAYWIVPKIAIYMGFLTAFLYKVTGENFKVTCYVAEFFNTLNVGVISLLLGSLILRLGHGLIDWYWLLCLLITLRIFRPYRVPEVDKEAWEQSSGLSMGVLKTITIISTFIVIMFCVFMVYRVYRWR